MGEFTGKTALVTGAGRNIGRAIALAFADAGANVGIVVRSNLVEGESVAAEVERAGARALVVQGNVGNPGDCSAMVDEIEGTLGSIHYLVNNAALRPRQSFLEISSEQWNEVLSTNLSSVFHLSRLVLPGMAERGFGRIINIGGPDGVRGMSLRAHNVASKAGLIGLTKAIAIEFGDHGITANVVVPGIMQTSRDEKDYPEIEKIIASLKQYHARSEISVPRPGSPEEVANGVMFFASQKAAYMTAQTLYVAGGLFGLP